MQIPYSELQYFDEVIAVGTAAMLVSIKSITRRSTEETFAYNIDGSGDGCKQLQQGLLDIQKGRVKSNEDWLWQVLPIGQEAGDEIAL